jgi:hypothetical protein
MSDLKNCCNAYVANKLEGQDQDPSNAIRVDDISSGFQAGVIQAIGLMVSSGLSPDDFLREIDSTFSEFRTPAEVERYKDFKIKEVWAFVVKGDDGEEGIPAIQGPGGMLMPMIASDKSRIDQYCDIAKQESKRMGKDFELRKFSNCTVVKSIKGTH